MMPRRMLHGVSHRVSGLFSDRSLRTKLVTAFGVLLGLGVLNLGVYTWSASERDEAFATLQHAIERQSIISDVQNRLEDRYKHVKYLSEVEGAGAAPSAQQRSSFAAAVDTIPTALSALTDTDSERDAAIERLQAKTELLTASWKTFYDKQWTDPTAALLELIQRAEPLAQELLTTDFPAAVDAEKAQLAEASAAFVQTDRTSSRIAWTILVLSALIGGTLAFVMSRDLLGALAALKAGVQRIGAGELSHRIQIPNRDELGDVAESFNEMADRLRQRTDEIEEQRKVSDSLLLNILPRQVADELRENGRVEPKYFADTTIMFMDCVGFTKLFDDLSVDRVVRLLHHTFTDFDRIIRTYNLEKLKTIGDAYMCAGGLSRGTSHPIDVVMAAFAILGAVEERAAEEGLPLAFRIGIHTGPVAAGVVGIDKFAFDVWGDTVNFAARVQAASEPNRINVSDSTYLRVKDFFCCNARGRVETKEGDASDMYFVSGVHPELSGTGRPPPGFAQRYKIYFDKDPLPFPAQLAAA